MKRINPIKFNKEPEMSLQHKSKRIKIALNRRSVCIKHLTLVITLQEELITFESIMIEGNNIKRSQVQEHVQTMGQQQPIALLKLQIKNLKWENLYSNRV